MKTLGQDKQVIDGLKKFGMEETQQNKELVSFLNKVNFQASIQKGKLAQLWRLVRKKR